MSRQIMVKKYSVNIIIIILISFFLFTFYIFYFTFTFMWCIKQVSKFWEKKKIFFFFVSLFFFFVHFLFLTLRVFFFFCYLIWIIPEQKTKLKPKSILLFLYVTLISFCFFLWPVVVYYVDEYEYTSPTCLPICLPTCVILFTVPPISQTEREKKKQTNRKNRFFNSCFLLLSGINSIGDPPMIIIMKGWCLNTCDTSPYNWLSNS